MGQDLLTPRTEDDLEKKGRLGQQLDIADRN